MVFDGILAILLRPAVYQAGPNSSQHSATSTFTLCSIGTVRSSTIIPCHFLRNDFSYSCPFFKLMFYFCLFSTPVFNICSLAFSTLSYCFLLFSHLFRRYFLFAMFSIYFAHFPWWPMWDCA